MKLVRLVIRCFKGQKALTTNGGDFETILLNARKLYTGVCRVCLCGANAGFSDVALYRGMQRGAFYGVV
jgi:hypothetical protein